jgi:hypothetical protein
VLLLLLQPDASSWLDGSGTPSECSMRVLTVPGCGTTIINGSLPSGFDEGHNPRFWVLEFIAKVRRMDPSKRPQPVAVVLTPSGTLCPNMLDPIITGPVQYCQQSAGCGQQAAQQHTAQNTVLQ